MTEALILENVELDGQLGRSVRIAGGRVVEIGPRITGPGQRIDGRGGALMVGLVDHHIHLLAAAARNSSLDLSGVRDRQHLIEKLARASAAVRPGTWIRAVGFHEGGGALPSLADLDAILPDHPVRIQHQTGQLWLLNGKALEQLPSSVPLPIGAERDHHGRATGRFWREDRWLRAHVEAPSMDLASLGGALARHGIVGLTDASASNDRESAKLLASARQRRAIPQHLQLMSAASLPLDDSYRIGPIKILLDDDRLPELSDVIDCISDAARAHRNVAIHCATAVQLAYAVAAFQSAGARAGDRIEHGSLIDPAMICQLAGLGLTVVTQPIFCRDRGDRYLDNVEPGDQADLYRCASLIRAGIPIAASSDAPYGSLDPWAGMRSAVMRQTAGGRAIAREERVSPELALALYQGGLRRPHVQRRIAIGAPADLCLLQSGMAEALDVLSSDLVRATIIGGEIVHAQA